MSIPIQLICVGSDQYELLESAARRLNNVQTEFRFELVRAGQRPSESAHRREIYRTEEVLSLLQSLRGTGGYRPFVIGFVNGPLESPRHANLFGSHRAEAGVAVVTTHQSNSYVAEAVRYCCFYLARYALSFLNPHIRSHRDAARATCYFHFKMYKPDIRLAMDSGEICDACRRELAAMPPKSGAMTINNEQWAAIESMLGVISGQIKRALILKGGGIKGLAFASTLVELKRFYSFDLFVGTSAGAIAAVLLAADYEPDELVSILRQKNFREFMDAPLWRIPLNLILHRGMYRGKAFSKWLTDLLAAKISQQREVLMKDLDKALVFASRRGNGSIAFETDGSRSETPAAFAARCSMSIPFFFTPTHVDGRNVYDGGLRANFPLEQFQNLHPYKPFVAVYLGRRDLGDRKGLLGDLIDIAIDADEREIVDRNREYVVEIDPTPISTLDFKLSENEKDFLIQLGRSSALEFLLRRNLNGGPTAAEVKVAQEKTESLRRRVESERRGARRIRRRVAQSAAAAIVMALGVAIVVATRG